MTIGFSGWGDCEEERRVVFEVGCYSKFLVRFADHRLAGVFTILDVTAGRQPQPGLAVIAEEQASFRAVDRDEVDHQVLGRRGGRARAEELLTRCHPVEDVGLVGRFALIEWVYAFYETRDR